MEYKIIMEGKTAFIEYDGLMVKVDKERHLTLSDTGSILEGQTKDIKGDEQIDSYMFEAVDSDHSPIYKGVTSSDIHHFMDFFFNELLSVDDFTIIVPEFSAFYSEYIL